jgi:hypothetical protein
VQPRSTAANCGEGRKFVAQAHNFRGSAIGVELGLTALRF